MLSRIVICSPAFKYMGFGSRASGSKVRKEIKEFYSNLHCLFHYPYVYTTI